MTADAWEKTMAQTKAEAIRGVFPKGSRVRPSEMGRRAVSSAPRRRLGTVMGYCRDHDCVLVLWEGLKVRQPWYRDYVERVESPLAEIIKAEDERLRIAHDRADGALADAGTVPTGDLEKGIRALTAERDGLMREIAEWEGQDNRCPTGHNRRFTYTLEERAGCVACERDGAEADVKALAEALETVLPYAKHSFACPNATSAFTGRLIEAIISADNALARDGVRRGKGEG